MKIGSFLAPDFRFQRLNMRMSIVTFYSIDSAEPKMFLYLRYANNQTHCSLETSVEKWYSLGDSNPCYRRERAAS